MKFYKNENLLILFKFNFNKKISKYEVGSSFCKTFTKLINEGN